MYIGDHFIGEAKFCNCRDGSIKNVLLKHLNMRLKGHTGTCDAYFIQLGKANAKPSWVALLPMSAKAECVCPKKQLKTLWIPNQVENDG